MHTLGRDVRVALRRLRRAPLFTLVAVATLALGIGGSAAIFSVVDAVLLEPLPYPAPDRLLRVYETAVDDPTVESTLSPPNYVDLRDAAGTLRDIGVFHSATFTLTEGAAERVPGQRATASFFAVLGMPPLLGRTFTPEEEAPGVDRVALLAEPLWRSRLGADPGVVGREIRLDGEAYRVVGVMPAGFGYPDATAQVWTPRSFTEDDLATQRGAHYLNAVARRADGAELERVNAELATIGARLEAAHPDQNTGIRFRAVSLRDDLVGEYGSALLILLGAVGMVLLIAAVNVAGLFLVRALDRRRETAVRTALGAGRGSLVREVLAESVLISVAGGALGLAVASLATGFLVRMQAEDVPRLEGVGIDGSVLAFTFAVAVLVGLIFGFIPGWRASRVRALGEELKDGRSGIGPAPLRLRSGLVVGQVVLAVVLLGGGGLLGRSFLKLTRVDPGFRTDHVLTFNISLPEARYGEPAQARQYVQRALAEVRSVPGVEEAGAIFGLPLSGFAYIISVERMDGAPAYDAPGEEPYLHVRVVTPGYLDALAIDVVEGRALTAADRAGAAPAVLLNRAAARQLWPDGPALHHTLELGTRLGVGGERLGGEVVGVVEDVRFYGARRDPVPEIYATHDMFPVDFMSVAVHTTGDPEAVVPAIRARLSALDPEVPLSRVTTMEALAAESVAQAWFYAVLLGAFGVIALGLAAVGLYGVMAYSVARRTREIGVRKALGADAREVLRLVLGRAMLLVGTGTAVGLALGIATTRVLSDLLFELAPTDPVTLAGAAAVLVGAGLAATYLPARRATRVDPAVALREE